MLPELWLFFFIASGGTTAIGTSVTCRALQLTQPGPTQLQLTQPGATQVQ